MNTKRTTAGYALVGALLACVGTAAAANDTALFTLGGFRPMGDGDTGVRMVSERIEITLTPQVYLVDVEFNFLGGEQDETLSVGFPSWGWGGGDSKVLGFRTWVNGESVDFTLERGTPPEYQDAGPAGAFDAWYVKTVEFPADTTTTTRVQYRNTYGSTSGYLRAEYLYGTGASWAGSIGRIDVVVNLTDDLWVSTFAPCPRDCGAESVEITPAGERTVLATMLNVEPGPDDVVSLRLSNKPPWIPIVESGTERSFATSTWSQRSVSDLTLAQLRILRNYFYARLGYQFQSEDLAAYFSMQDWYKPGNFVDKLNAVQRENIETLRAVEAIRNPDGKPVVVTPPPARVERTWPEYQYETGALQLDIETPEYTRVWYRNTTSQTVRRVTIEVTYRASGKPNQTVVAHISRPVVPGGESFVDVPVPEGMYYQRIAITGVE